MAGKGKRVQKRRRPRRAPRRSSRRFLRHALALSCVLLFLIGSALGIFYYARFQRLMDARLEAFQPARTAIYSAPLPVFSGGRFEPEAFRVRLHRLGYAPGPGDRFGDWYEREGESFKIYHTLPGQLRTHVEVRVASGRVEEIRDNGRLVESTLLRPLLLSNLFDDRRERKRFTPFDRLPETLVQAVLAAEDERFFSHSGFDLRSILRASYVNVAGSGPRQGGSTLTQQFVKNFFLTSERTFRRKLQELYFAILLERKYDKERIFELYANEVYLGQRSSFAIHGFGEAAALVFGKDVRDLTLAESALLAGMIQAPNRYSPWRRGEDARNRRNYVLSLMEQKGMIALPEAEAAKAEPLAIQAEEFRGVAEAPHFVDYVHGLVTRLKIGWRDSSEVQVHTTLNPDLQGAAAKAVREGLAAVDRAVSGARRPEAALVALDPRSGDILAMIGGRDYGKSQFNRAVYAYRQPGSTFKPIVYAAAFQISRDWEPPLTTASFFLDEPHTFQFRDQEYAPRNSGNQYFGPVPLRQALAHSLNIPSVKLGERIGFDRLVEFVRRLEFSRPPQPYPSLPLGAFEVSLLELAQAYTPLAGGGDFHSASAVNSLQADGASLARLPRNSFGWIDPEIAFLVASMLETAIEEGTGKAVRSIGFAAPAAGKTGTADDGWFIGFTPELLCGVWVGHDDSSPLSLSGSRAALPIWTTFMQEAQRLGYLKGERFEPPPGVVAVEIDPLTGWLATDRCPDRRTEYFVAGTEPARFCPGKEDRAQYAAMDGQPVEKTGGGVWGWLKRIF